MSGRRSCCVWGCLNTYNNNPTYSFFSLPTDITRRNMWLELILREDLMNKNHKSYVVCEIHFDEQFIIQHSKFKILSRKAIPTLHLPLRSQLLTQQPPDQEQQVQQHKEIQVDIFRLLETENTKKDTFNSLCDRFLSKELSQLVKAELQLKPHSQDDESPGGHSDDSSMDSNCSRTSRKDSETTAVTHRSGDVHEGFTCNACSGSIVGFRYVCVQCAHYSLCACCESRGEHSLHYVLRIPRLAPHDEVASMLSKIRMHLLYGLDTEEAEQETDDRAVPALPEEPIKVEIKEELPDPLEHEDAFQPDDDYYTEPEYTRESTSKEQRVALVPDTRSIITETEQNYAILNNPVKVTETAAITTKHRNIVIEPAHGSRFKIYVEPSQECEATKRKNTTEPEHGPEKHIKMYHEEQSRAIETMMEILVDTAGQSTDGASELLQEIKTEEKDEGSFEVFSHTLKKILEVGRPGLDNEKYMAATARKKTVKKNVIVSK